MSNEQIDQEILDIINRINAIDIEKEQLQRALNELESNRSNSSSNNVEEQNVATNTRVTASDLASRTGVNVPPKYHRFASSIKKDSKGKRIYVGDKVRVKTRGSSKSHIATVVYLTEFKVTVITDNETKSSREPSFLEVVEPFDRKGKPF